VLVLPCFQPRSPFRPLPSSLLAKTANSLGLQNQPTMIQTSQDDHKPQATRAWTRSPTSLTTLPHPSHLGPTTTAVSCSLPLQHNRPTLNLSSVPSWPKVPTRQERQTSPRPARTFPSNVQIFFQALIFVRPIQFLKPTDLLVREDPFRPKRALLGPGAAESRRNDWFYQLGIDPLDEATNPRLLSYFVTDMGKVKSRAETKLTWRNQRRLTKAIRRAKMMGVMPILNKQISSYRGNALL